MSSATALWMDDWMVVFFGVKNQSNQQNFALLWLMSFFWHQIRTGVSFIIETSWTSSWRNSGNLQSELSQLLGDIRCLTLRSFFSICPLKSPEQGHSFKFWPRIADPLCNVWHFGVPSQALRTVPSSLLKPKSLGVRGPPPSFPDGSDVTRRFQAYFDIPRLLLDPRPQKSSTISCKPLNVINNGEGHYTPED